MAEIPVLRPSMHLHKCLECGAKQAYTTERNGKVYHYCMACGSEKPRERSK